MSPDYDPEGDIDMTEADVADISFPEKVNAPDDSVTISDDNTPEDFDFEEFLSGMRPLRRKVRIYARGDLIAELDRIVQEIDDIERTMSRDDDGEPLPSEVDRVDPLIDPLVRKWHEARAQLDKSARWFTVRARSAEWIEKFTEEMQARDDIAFKTATIDGKETQVLASTHDRVSYYAELLARQIVSPANVTVEGLKRLYAVADGEFDRLVGCVTAANALTVQGSVGRDFSQRHSATPGGSGS